MMISAGAKYPKIRWSIPVQHS